MGKIETDMIAVPEKLNTARWWSIFYEVRGILDREYTCYYLGKSKELNSDAKDTANFIYNKDRDE